MPLLNVIPRDMASVAQTMTAALACAEYGLTSAETVVVALHGLLGSKRNWHSIARTLSENPTRESLADVNPVRFIALDVRNHGESPWMSPHSLETIADDVSDALRRVRKESPNARIVCAGHSMGGVAMAYGVTRRRNPIDCDALCLVDCAPAPRPPSFRDLAVQVRAMKNMQVSDLTSRKEVVDRLKSVLSPGWRQQALLQFFASNIATSAGAGGAWTTNIDELVRSLDEGSLLWESFAADTCPNSIPTHACFAEDSPYYTEAALAGVRDLFPSAAIDNVSTGGHFHNVYQPDQYLRKLLPWMVKHRFI